VGVAVNRFLRSVNRLSWSVTGLFVVQHAVIPSVIYAILITSSSHAILYMNYTSVIISSEKKISEYEKRVSENVAGELKIHFLKKYCLSVITKYKNE
jgi:hypothetical protein